MQTATAAMLNSPNVLEHLDRIERAVQIKLSGRVRDFRLTKEPDGLVLSGCTRTYYAKQLAQHAVMNATDIPILENDIEVL